MNKQFSHRRATNFSRKIEQGMKNHKHCVIRANAFRWCSTRQLEISVTHSAVMVVPCHQDVHYDYIHVMILRSISVICIILSGIQPQSFRPPVSVLTIYWQSRERCNCYFLAVWRLMLRTIFVNALKGCQLNICMRLLYQILLIFANNEVS